MKGLMKKTLAGLMLAGVMTSAVADNAMPGQASMEINMKIMEEVMAEIPADKMSDANLMTEKMIEKMKANEAALKEAAKKDCVAIYGEAKTSECECSVDKTDYDEVFEMMKKQAANPTQNLEAEMKAMAEKGEKNTLACGFTKAEIDEANAKAMKMMQDSAPKK